MPNKTIVLAGLLLLLPACYTVEKRAACPLKPLPDQAFLWWELDPSGGSNGLDVLIALKSIPGFEGEDLVIERNEDGKVTAIYGGEESRRIIASYAACIAAKEER